ncbi:DUF6478 family protein [Sulfitobacter sp. LCG007]
MGCAFQEARAQRMVETGDSMLDRALFRRLVRHWARAARQAETARPQTLHRQATHARLLRTHLDRLILTAGDRLAPTDAPAPARAHNTDWHWRPEPWSRRMDRPGLSDAASGTRFGTDTALFHDCPRREVILRQLRNPPSRDIAPFALSVDVYGFEGSFLSLALDLPDEALAGLRRAHVIRLDCSWTSEQPGAVYARLNLRQGPNGERILRQLPEGQSAGTVEFDLAYADLDPARTEQGWVDLIVERPEMNQVLFRDIALSRRLRAEV